MLLIVFLALISVSKLSQEVWLGLRRVGVVEEGGVIWRREEARVENQSHTEFIKVNSPPWWQIAVG